MKMKQNMAQTIAIVLVIGVLSAGLTSALVSGNPNMDPLVPENRRVLEVTGIGEIEIDPDVAWVYVTVEEQLESAEEVQKVIADKIRNIKIQLMLKGVDTEDIESTNYRIYPVSQYINEVYQVVGYKGTHTLKIQTINIDGVGTLIDTSIEAGANRVDQVQFGLSEELQKALKMDAYEEAGSDAKTRAEAIATGLGLSVKDVIRVSEGYSYTPYMYAGTAMLEDGMNSYTEIEPGTVKVTVRLNVVFEIE